MKIPEMIIKANIIIGDLYNTRKDVTKAFEFDYVCKLVNDYNILKNGSSEWILQDKVSLKQYFLTIKTKKEDNQVYLKSIKYLEIDNIYKFS